MKPVVGVQVERDDAAATQSSQNAPTDDRLVVKWLENQPNSTQYVLFGLFETSLTTYLDLHMRS